MTGSSGRPDAKRFVQPLPAQPDLEKQKKLAKMLARRHLGETVDLALELRPAELFVAAVKGGALMSAPWASSRSSEAAADAVLATDPAVIDQASPQVLRQVADAARNNNTAAVKAMLARGFPVTAVSQHGATPLHWAAFHGNPEMLQTVLRHGPSLEMRDRDFNGTPMGWAIHGAVGHWRGISTAEHGACVRLLLDAGAEVDEAALPTGHDDVDRVLRAHFLKA